jgi:hypothetical protein
VSLRAKLARTSTLFSIARGSSTAPCLVLGQQGRQRVAPAHHGVACVLPIGSRQGSNTNVNYINDERNAAKKAEAVLNSLVPSSPRTNAQLDTLRQTADIANEAMQNNFSNQTDLNAKRGEAATALRGVSGSLERLRLALNLCGTACSGM